MCITLWLEWTSSILIFDRSGSSNAGKRCGDVLLLTVLKRLRHLWWEPVWVGGCFLTDFWFTSDVDVDCSDVTGTARWGVEALVERVLWGVQHTSFGVNCSFLIVHWQPGNKSYKLPLGPDIRVLVVLPRGVRILLQLPWLRPWSWKNWRKRFAAFCCSTPVPRVFVIALLISLHYGSQCRCVSIYFPRSAARLWVSLPPVFDSFRGPRSLFCWLFSASFY